MPKIIIVIFLIFLKISTTTLVLSKEESPSDDADFKNKLSKMYNRINKSEKLIRQQIVENQNAPFLADLYLQLGELISQKASVLYYIMMEREASPDSESKSAKQFDPVIVAKKDAIEIYNKILQEFPNFNKKDKTLYNLALSLYSIDEVPKFNKILSLLNKAYPGSEESTRGNLILGQYFQDKGDFLEAQKIFIIIANSKFVYERNVAKYRLGLISNIQGRYKKALDYFEKVITDQELKENSNPFEVSLKAKEVKSSLKREALMDSIMAYTHVYKKDKAKPVQYYSKITPNEQLFQEVIEKLAFRYIYLKEFRSAIKMLRTLAERTVQPQKVINIYQEVLLMIPLNERIQLPVEEIRFLLEKYNLWRSFYKISPLIKKQSYHFFEKQVRDLGTRSHTLSKAAKNKRQKESYTQKALDFYLLYLAYFTNTSSSIKMATNLADVYFTQKNWISSGEYYFRIYLGEFGTPQKMIKRKLIENALLCFQKNGDYSFYELVRIKGLLINALTSYMELIPQYKKNPKLNFILAKTRYEQGFYDVALDEMISFINRFPNSLYSVKIGDMILDYFNTRNDFGGLIFWSQKILSSPIKNKTFRQKVAKINDMAKVKKLQDQVEADTNFDTFAQGKSYLKTALSMGSSAISDLAFKQALASSKKEKDMVTFFKTAKIMAEKKKSKKQKFEILYSIGKEQMRITFFEDSLDTFENIFKDNQMERNDRMTAYSDALGLAITIRDWNRISNYLEYPLWKNAGQGIKNQLNEQIGDLLESPISIPSGLVDIIDKIGMNNQVALGAYKAQPHIDSNILNKMQRYSRKTCNNKLSPAICKWKAIERADQLNARFQDRLNKSKPSLNAIESLAGLFTKILENYTKLEGEDPHLDLILSIRQKFAYLHFGQFLKKVGKVNPQYRSVLYARAKESYASGKLYNERCQKIINQYSIATPANKFCFNNKVPTLKESLTWSHYQSSDEIKTPSADSYKDERKNVFASEKNNKPLLEIAYKYFKDGHYHHATGSSILGLSAEDQDKKNFSTILGCSVFKMGYYSEAKYHLKNGSNYNNLRSECHANLKQLEMQ